MKLTALTAMAAGVLVAGAAVAQSMGPPATMQPIPNPPETGHKSAHHGAAKHHAMHHKAAKTDAKDAAAPK
jgi:hypothetical protein